MRYTYKVFEKLYYWIDNNCIEIHFSQLIACLKYKFEDGVDDGLFFGKTQDRVLEDFKILLQYIVYEIKDFHIEFCDEKNAYTFYNTNEFWDFVTKNNIDIFDDITSIVSLNLIKNKKQLKIPTNIPEYIHQIFEPYLFCELKIKKSAVYPIPTPIT
jgi:hypothetical protein